MAPDISISLFTWAKQIVKKEGASGVKILNLTKLKSVSGHIVRFNNEEGIQIILTVVPYELELEAFVCSCVETIQGRRVNPGRWNRPRVN